MTATARDNETALALQRMVAGNVYSSAQADAIAAALSAARAEEREAIACAFDGIAGWLFCRDVAKRVRARGQAVTP